MFSVSNNDRHFPVAKIQTFGDESEGQPIEHDVKDPLPAHAVGSHTQNLAILHKECRQVLSCHMGRDLEYYHLILRRPSYSVRKMSSFVISSFLAFSRKSSVVGSSTSNMKKTGTFDNFLGFDS